MELIILHLEAVLGKLVEIVNALIQGHLGRCKAFVLQHCLHSGDMTVINMAVSDHVDQLACFQTCYLCHHHQQHGVLHHIPVVGGEHILGALVQNAIKGVAGHIEGHGVCAGIQIHLVQVIKIIDAGEGRV